MGIFGIRYYSPMKPGILPIETLYRGYRFRSRLEARWAVFFDVAGIPWQYEVEGFDLSSVQAPTDVKGLWFHELGERGHLTYKDIVRMKQAEVVNEGPDEGSSMWYLPDFYLPEQDAWVEVKGSEPSLRERRLMERLVWATRKRGYIFWDIRPPSEVLRSRLPVDFDRKSGLCYSVIENFEAFLERKNVIGTYDEPWVRGMFEIRRDEPKPILVGLYRGQWCECPKCGMLDIAPEGEAEFMSCGCMSVPFDDVTEMIANRPEVYYTDDSPRLMRAYMAARQVRFEHGAQADVYYVMQSKLDRIRELLDSDEL